MFAPCTVQSVSSALISTPPNIQQAIMKETSLRRSLSERKIAKKDRKEKTRSAHLDNSMTPISIIGGEQQPETMNGYVEHGTLDHQARGKKTKFWNLKVISMKSL